MELKSARSLAFVRVASSFFEIMVGAKAIQHILVVKSARHLSSNNDQVGLTHPQSSSCSSNSGHSGRHIEPDTGGNQAGLVQLPEKAARVNGEKYFYKGNVCMWRNGKICCEHGRQKSRCKECGGSGICEHGRQKSQCKECGGSSICEHGRQKRQCKECG